MYPDRATYSAGWSTQVPKMCDIAVYCIFRLDTTELLERATGQGKRCYVGAAIIHRPSLALCSAGCALRG